MGVMRFVVSSHERFSPRDHFHRAFLSGMEGRVFPVRIELNDGLLTCLRGVSESANLNIAWPVEGFGTPVLKTTTLMEREEPYRLPLELARGKISQFRDQFSQWEHQGMQIPPGCRELGHQAYELFVRALSMQHSDVMECEDLSQQALVLACQAADLLTRTYIQQRLQFRRRRSKQLPAMLGCNLGWGTPNVDFGDSFLAAFTAAMIPAEWKVVEPHHGSQQWELVDRQVEWCRDQRLMMYGGPLIDLTPGGMPDWLWEWESDFQNLQSLVCDFVETVIARYCGTIRHWEIAARANTGGALAMSEEKRLSLVAKALEVAHQVDDEIQLMIGIDQPWGDYQARGHHRLSPFQFVDALVRSGVGLSGVNLEFGVGYHPSGSAERDLLEFSQLIDHWSRLGIPIYVTLAYPSSVEHDSHAQPDFEPDQNAFFNESRQAEWIERYLSLSMAKQSVVGIFWSHFSDSAPHSYPNAGLLRSDRTEKPALHQITKYRKTYWSAKEPH
ncbi:MAG: hypothetical protein Tsb009_17450 [Planctomycetaceae bacterium]